MLTYICVRPCLIVTGRYEVDKLSASQRLDLNLEKGRMRDELQVLRDKSNEMEIKMDRETNALKAAVEQSKNEVAPCKKHDVHMILLSRWHASGSEAVVIH